MKHYAYRFEPCGHTSAYDATTCPTCRAKEMVKDLPPLTQDQVDKLTVLLGPALRKAREK